MGWLLVLGYIVGVIFVPATIRCVIGDKNLGLHGEEDNCWFAVLMGFLWPIGLPIVIVIMIVYLCAIGLASIHNRLVTICRRFH